MNVLFLLSWLPLLVLPGEDLVFIGPGYGSFLKSDLIDFWTDDPVDCQIPHYPLFNGDPELNQIQGLVGAVLSDRVTLCGGWYVGPDQRYNNNHTNACYYFNPDSKAWESFPNLLVEGSHGDSVVFSDGRWWILGGFKDYESGYYDDATELYTDGVGWTQGPTLPMENTYHCAAPLGDKYTLIAGGANSNGRNKTWLYDSASQEFLEVMGLELPAERHACIALDQKNVMMAGGYSYSAGHGTLDTVSVFNLDTLSWTPVEPLPEPLSWHSLVRDGEDVLALGGIGQEGRIYRYKSGRGWTLENKQMRFGAHSFPAMLVTRTMLGC